MNYLLSRILLILLILVGEWSNFGTFIKYAVYFFFFVIFVHVGNRDGVLQGIELLEEFVAPHRGALVQQRGYIGAEAY